MFHSTTARLSACFRHREAVRDAPRPHLALEVYPGQEERYPGMSGTSARGVRTVCRGVPYPAPTRLLPWFYPVSSLNSECSKVSFLLFSAVLIRTSEKTLTRRPGRPTYGQNHYGTESLFRNPSSFLQDPQKPDQ